LSSPKTFRSIHITDFVAHVVSDPAPHAGRIYTLTGPASISLRDAAAQAQVDAAYQPLTPAQAYEAMRQSGLDEWVASMGAEYATAYSRGWGDYANTDFTDVMGRQAPHLRRIRPRHPLTRDGPGWRC
jgi:hypothetical protein